MDSDQMHPLAMSGKDPSILRGDPIPKERYFSKEFMDLEWEHLWRKIWHIAGREQQLEQPGDFIVHDFMRESVIVAKQNDGSLKGLFELLTLMVTLRVPLRIPLSVPLSVSLRVFP